MGNLKPEVAEKYALKKGHQATVVITKAPNRRQVDLTKITLKEVKSLIAAGVSLPLEEKKVEKAPNDGMKKLKDHE